MKQEELIRKTKRFMPNLEEVQRYLEDPEKVVSEAFPLSRSRLKDRAIVRGNLESVKPDAYEIAIGSERKRAIEAGRSGVAKVLSKGEKAELTHEEAFGLEAIIGLVGRPAILIQDGHFFPPPPEWKILEDVRGSVEEACKSVGRIEVPGHPQFDWIGTGFLVAQDVIMTNRHVAEEFCRLKAKEVWEFKPSIKPQIDYGEEFGTQTCYEFGIQEVIGIHSELDLALLRVSYESSQGSKLPEPLVVSSDVPDHIEGRKVYVLGYPAWDGYRNNPEPMRRIFNDIYGVKRLQPGEVTSLQPSVILHDCTTLGGNSGSCVIDLETNLVIGLHYSGRYLETNLAVALPLIKADPLLKKAGVNFD